jgi:molybdenum cofactor cytidylyltransferase
VILAAGASTRFGSPKQVAEWRGETLLDRSIRVAQEAGCQPVVVVLGAHEASVRSSCKLQGVVAVSNPGWAQGMGSSIACGIAAIGEADGVLLMTCDMPAVTPEHLRALAASGLETASLYAEVKGIPAYFPRSAFARLRKLDGDGGAKALLKQAGAVALPAGERDIDRPQDLDWATEPEDRQ